MEEVHSLAYHGQGGFPISDVWDLPVPHRRYHIRMINKHIEEKNEEMEKARGSKTNTKSLDKPNLPPKPTYTSNVKS